MKRRRWGQGTISQRGSRWRYAWVDEQGQRHWGSAASKLDAQREMNKWMAEAEERASEGGTSATVEDLCDLLVEDYEDNGKDVETARRRCLPIRRLLGHVLARDLTKQRIADYILVRRKEISPRTGRPLKLSSLNRELSAIHRMFVLAHKRDLVPSVPMVTKTAEKNVRTGFFEPDQFQAICDHLAADYLPVFQLAYYTGWRVPSEILTLRWTNVDFQQGWLRLEPGTTKNHEGRDFLLIGPLATVLRQQQARVTAVEREVGHPIEWVCIHTRTHRRTKAGDPIRDYRVAWQDASTKAGIDRIPHDFRRTAVRNLIRAGVDRISAMQMVGHKTQSIFQRYAITDSKMLTEAGRKYETFLTGQKD